MCESILHYVHWVNLRTFLPYLHMESVLIHFHRYIIMYCVDTHIVSNQVPLDGHLRVLQTFAITNHNEVNSLPYWIFQLPVKQITYACIYMCEYKEIWNNTQIFDNAYLWLKLRKDENPNLKRIQTETDKPIYISNCLNNYTEKRLNSRKNFNTTLTTFS